jgi:DNA-binding beta-propeller fold protein YncE
MSANRRRRGWLAGTIGIAATIAMVLLSAVVAAGTSPGRPVVAGATLSLTKNSNCTVGSSPITAAYDPVNHEVYVPNSASHNLSILSGCTVVATVTFPNPSAHPLVAAFDPANNYVYVTDESLDRVYEISGSKLITAIASGHFDAPYGIAFDPGDGVMAVANLDSNNVTFINSANVYIGTNTVGLQPRFLGYDPYYARLLVTNYGSNNVTSMDALYPFIESHNVNIPVGTCPAAVAFNYANDEDYVANECSQNVSVFFGTGSTGQSLGVGTDPAGVVWDQARLAIYVTNQLTNNVSVIQGSTVVRTITGPGTATFTGIAYDDATNKVYVVDDGGKVYVYT